MAEHGVALCPTLAAGDATAQYAGWTKGQQPEPERLSRKRASFKAALAAGVTILSGSDVGVFPHGENARELELMADYGMRPSAVLQSATSGAAACCTWRRHSARSSLACSPISRLSMATRFATCPLCVAFDW